MFRSQDWFCWTIKRAQISSLLDVACWPLKCLVLVMSDVLGCICFQCKR